jgi:APA family basic amino acid/polyamine antiporter
MSDKQTADGQLPASPGEAGPARGKEFAKILKFVPLLFMATVGLFFIKAGNFGSFNPSHLSLAGAVSAAAAIALFSYLGLETASVAAGRVKEPSRNVSRATIYGTLACAFIYILGT